MRKNSTTRKSSATQKQKKLNPLSSENWISESSIRTAAGASSPPSDSGSPGIKDLELKITPDRVCPCSGQQKLITASAKATGEGADKATVEIYGPNDTYASGKGAATLEYHTQETDRGTALDFTATATDRPDQQGKAYVMMATFVELKMQNGIVDSILDPIRPRSLLLTVISGAQGEEKGILTQAVFKVIPAVPNLNVCPFDYRIHQWVFGSQVILLTGQPTDNLITNKEETVTDVSKPIWVPQSQLLFFATSDLIGPHTNATQPFIQLMSIQAKANVYLQVKCKECEKFETIGKASWEINGAWAPAPPPPNQPLPAGGAFTSKDGTASSEAPAKPAW